MEGWREGGVSEGWRGGWEVCQSGGVGGWRYEWVGCPGMPDSSIRRICARTAWEKYPDMPSMQVRRVCDTCAASVPHVWDESVASVPCLAMFGCVCLCMFGVYLAS